MARDTGLILAAHNVEHYKIATYGTLRTFVQTLGYDNVAKLLQQTLKNDKDTNGAIT